MKLSDVLFSDVQFIVGPFITMLCGVKIEKITFIPMKNLHIKVVGEKIQKNAIILKKYHCELVLLEILYHKLSFPHT